MKATVNYIKQLPLCAKLLAVLMLITVLSFFVQSALPAETSAAESDKVSELIEPVIPSESPVGQVVHPNIRKIGHFAEFGAFGLEAAFFVYFFLKNRLRGALGFSAATLFIAFCDETLQIFSGRGPMIADVWIDFFGFSTLFALTYTLLFFAHILKRKFS